MTAPALVVEAVGVSKRFGAVQALTDVSLAFQPGEIHGLVGENGAGKSTLTKIIGGAQPPDEGDIRINGEPASFSAPADALRAGIVVIYQELSLIPELSVAANVFLGHEPRKRRMLDERGMRRRTNELLERLGAKFGAGRVAGELSVADQQVAEIARALNHRSQLVIMDEPTAALPAEAHGHLFDVVRALREDGTAVVYISHELGDVFDLCDRVTVMKDGRKVATTDTAQTTRDEVIKAMVGRPLGEMFPPRPARRPNSPT
jgi:ABC-type sugar transport system ATPase subunit